MAQSLAIKYRPQVFDDVVEQGEVKIILKNQLDSNEIKNAYLFTGGAGTGKTTTARIFANEINKGHGQPIELDAASNNSVDDVREIIQQAKTASLNSEYKIFIIDECHALSNNAWQAMLKLLEEPPAKSIFIMCTTDPQKIPKTILSRVQRYDFQRISQEGIVKRLYYILSQEWNQDADYYLKKDGALEYIAKIADGGMRDAITMLDKCLAYSTDLTMENVLQALGLSNYDVMIDLLKALIKKDSKSTITIINDIHSSGKDLKAFIKSFTNCILDFCKFDVTRSYDFIQIPTSYAIEVYEDNVYEYCRRLLPVLIRLNEAIKWDTTPKAQIEATLLMECFRGE